MSVEIVAFLVGVAHRQQVNVVHLQEILVCALVGIDADRQYLNALAFHPLLHLNQRGHLFDTGPAPCGPEIQDDHPTPKFIKADLAVAVLHRKPRRGCADVGRRGAAVTARQQEGHEADPNAKHVAQSYNT